MKQILVYGDSLSWGIIPKTRNRLAFNKRWPGVFEQQLIKNGSDVRVIENCLNGRRTVWEDPFKPGRNGAEGLAQVIEMHSPLSLVILLLGINDFQRAHENNAWLSAQGVARLIDIIRKAPIEPGMLIPEILIVSPPVITGPRADMTEKFEGAEMRCVGIADALKQVAKDYEVHFFDASSVIGTSQEDGIHLDEDQHATLGNAIASKVVEDMALKDTKPKNRRR